ncbi:MAG: glycosyltransferase [Candidatus Levyibacteriota bacterium]
MSNNPLVSIVVTTKNEQSHIGACLKSISQQSYRKLEVIVVDNNSSDGTKQISRKYTKYVYNFGPERSAQRNFGARKAKGEYLLFIDADMILTKNVVMECAKKMEISQVGAVVIPEKSVGEGYWTKVKAFERSLYEGDSSIEAARFFKKEVFWEFGGYDKKITGPEDWDLPQRIKKKYRIGRVKSFISHDEGRVSLLTLMKKKYYYGLKVPDYLSNDHPVKLTAQQVIYLLRPAFYRNWKLLTRNPKLTFGMMIMLLGEQAAGFIGFIKGILTRKRGNRK